MTAELGDAYVTQPTTAQRVAESLPWPHATYVVSANPLPSDIDWRRVQDVLGVKIVGLTGREIVDQPLLGESEPDLLGAEGQEVDGFGERPDVWVRVGLERDGLGGRDLHVPDALHDHLAAGLHGDSSTSGRPESVLCITVEVARRGGGDSRPCACGGAR